LVFEGVFREAGVIHSFKMVDSILFVFDALLSSCIPEISSPFLMISLLILSTVCIL
jgi:hypothetical protein